MSDLCELCNKDKLTADELLDHAATLINDTGLLHGLVMVHGKRRGSQRYVELGRVIHLTEEEAQQ